MYYLTSGLVGGELRNGGGDIEDMEQALVGIHLAIAEADRGGFGERVLIGREANSFFDFLVGQRGLGLEPQGDDACCGRRSH